jgi:putative ABC transport system permease protein
VTAIALRNLGERKLRTVLTSLAIVLGVMMVAGTYVLTDTINRSFDDIFTESNKGIDAVVQTHQAVETDNGQVPPFPEKVLDQVRQIDGVGVAAGEIADQQVQIIGSDGKPRGGNGAPSFGFSVPPKEFDPLTYVEGGPPQTDNDVVIDKASAEDEGFSVGDQVKVAGKEQVKSYTLVGIATLGDVDSFGGATLTEFTLPEAQRITGKEGELDQVVVAAADGTTPERLAANIKAQLPDTLEVRTGEQNVQDQRDDISDFTGFLKTALLIFAGVSLFVAAFLSFNTFSITVAQRTREFAMLRTLGANRRQILSTVVVEAFAIGLAAAIVGVAAGIGFASGLKGLFKALGIDLPATGTVIEPRTIIVGLVLGTGLTVLAALIPALRATRIAPVTGLREGAVIATPKQRRRRELVGGVLATIGIALMLLGLFEVLTPGAAWVGVGAGAVFIGTTLLSARLVTPLASVVGVPLERTRGIAGRIARENTIRNPNRTASTAAALMIGLALVSFVTVFAAGLKGSIDNAIDKTFTGDLILSNEDNFSDIPRKTVDAMKGIDGVAVASPLIYTQDIVQGIGKGNLTLVEPQTAAQVLSLEWKDGNQDLLTNMGPHDAVIDEKWGADHNLDVGDNFSVKTASGKVLDYTVTGNFTDNTDFIGDYAASTENAAAYGEANGITNVFINLDPGADTTAVRAQIDDVLNQQFPTVKSENQQELKDSIAKSLDGLLGVVYALLAFSIIVSLFGIVNTLALSIHERTRELGLLRAVGTSRRQVRRIVRYEAVITALIGAVLGAVLGVIFAVVISRPLASDGFILSIPVAQLVIMLVVAGLAGVVAAIGPARRASRMDVLEALAYE